MVVVLGMTVPVVHIAVRVVVHLIEALVPLEQLTHHVQAGLGQCVLATMKFVGGRQQVRALGHSQPLHLG
ncbi:hypothetical protein D9M69_367280 [compost metagenome]